MTDITELGDTRLPDDVKAIDAELASIAYEERPSFGPELKAELADAWANRPLQRPGYHRYLVAAAIAGLLVVGAAVPPARAALVILIGAISPGVPEPTEDPVALETPPAPVMLAVIEPEPEPEPPIPEPSTPEPVAAPEVEPAAPPMRPKMLDRARAQALLEEAYPPRLQRAGIGGELWLRAWVDMRGMASMASVARSSGVADLDDAALEVAPLLRFEPATQNGSPVATWIEFPVRFEPDEAFGSEATDATMASPDPLQLPRVSPSEQWTYDEPLNLAELPWWSERPASDLTEAEAALVEAIGDPLVRRSLGPIESILAGVAPANRRPLEWRESARRVLEDALARAPENPAPLLALGRIRLRQGLRTDARMLFEQGLQIAIQSDASVPPSIVAELHFERGRLIRESWMAARSVGRVHSYAFDEAPCPQARASARSTTGFASVERLVAWNYLCPAEARRVFRIGFEPNEAAVADLSLMMASFRAAIDVDPGHVGSNVSLLVTLADEARWDDVLAGARRFARRSGGHPEALLLGGLALQRLERTGEAATYFEAALERLSPAEADRLRDLTYVLDATDAATYRRLSGDDRRAWEQAYWDARDRTPSTPVNEREIEHLARSAYASMRFGRATSDPAEVWVRFGGPNTVHIVDEGAGQLTEFWDYGSGPDITFVRWVASQTMDLTPEGRAYVDDLGKIFAPE